MVVLDTTERTSDTCKKEREWLSSVGPTVGFDRINLLSRCRGPAKIFRWAQVAVASQRRRGRRFEICD